MLNVKALKLFGNVMGWRGLDSRYTDPGVLIYTSALLFSTCQPSYEHSKLRPLERL